MRLALQFVSRFVCAENGGDATGIMHANRPQIGAWETFTTEPQTDGGLALKTINGKYVCAENGGGQDVHANRDAVGAWERWIVSGSLVDGASVSFMAPDGHYMGVGTEADGVIHARATLPFFFRVTVLEADPVKPTLLPLHQDGWDIRTSNGARYVHKQATNYLLFQRFLEGHDLSNLLYEGFDGYNVTFLMKTVPNQAGLPDLTPANYPNFYQKADDFLSWMDKGKRVEATLLCDCTQLGFDHAAQVTHTERMYEILRAHPAHLCQLANEWENNGVDAPSFTKPAGVFWSRGSSLAGGPCPLPGGDYSTAHLSRSGGGAYLDAQPYYMLAGYAGYAGTNGPVITNETRGASNTENSDRRSTDPAYFRRIASAARGWSGMTFHFDYGIHSDPILKGSVQDQCRLAFLEGIG